MIKDSQVRFATLSNYPGYRFGSDGSVWTAWKLSSNGIGTGTWSYIGDTFRRMSTRAHSQGYRIVQLKVGHRAYRVRYVHQLILEAFVGPRPQGMVARHKNDQQDDNRLENLCWGTEGENLNDRHRNKPEATPRGSAHWRARLDVDKVASIKARLREGDGPYAIAKAFGLSPSTVYDIARGRTWKEVA